MPSGYTADVADGKVSDFKTFALRCARAFGALIEMRDDDMNAPLRMPEPSSYHANALAEARQRLAEVSAMTLEDAEPRAEAAYREAVAGWEQRRGEQIATEQRYRAMLTAVEAWTPPSPEHEEMKRFMRKQLLESIDWDCERPMSPQPTRESALQWLSRAQGRAVKDVAYHEEQLAEEHQRIAERRQWIQQLQDSLDGVTA